MIIPCIRLRRKKPKIPVKVRNKRAKKGKRIDRCINEREMINVGG